MFKSCQAYIDYLDDKILNYGDNASIILNSKNENFIE